MKFNELAGDAHVDPAHAVKQITSWFDADDKFVLVGMRQTRITTGQNVFSQAVVAKEFVQQLRGPRGTALLEGLSKAPDGANCDVYFSVATVDGNVPLNRRGEIDAIKDVKGVYVDLDVKPGSFETQEDALAYLRKLPHPTLITFSGSGGVHAFWRFTTPLSADEAARVQKAWYALLAEKAAPVFVDRLIDASRVMRLAGAIRWPKAKETIPPRLSTVYWRNLDNRYPAETLLEWSKDAASRAEERIRETRAKDSHHKINAASLSELSGEENSWARLAAVANVEDRFSELMSWEEILEPAGWTFLREDNQGRKEVARPGSGSKSGTCGWPISPNVLSLHSWSPETNLADLKEAGIVLTKFRVAQRLIFNDDYDEIVKWTLENG
jgi:hypothetical protein